MSLNALFFPAIIEKGKLYLQLKKYHELTGIADEAMMKSNGHFEALLLSTMNQYLSGNSKSQRIENMKKVVKAIIDSQKPNNDLLFRVSKFFSYLCGYDKETLNLTKQLIEMACNFDPSNEQYRLEHAYQLRRMRTYKEAISEYQFASSLDINDASGLLGMILAQILSGEIEDAKAQRDFVSVMDNFCKR